MPHSGALLYLFGAIPFSVTLLSVCSVPLGTALDRISPPYHGIQPLNFQSPYLGPDGAYGCKLNCSVGIRVVRHGHIKGLD